MTAKWPDMSDITKVQVIWSDHTTCSRCGLMQKIDPPNYANY